MFLDFYGLRQQPFGVTPDPAYLYPSPTHREALAALSSGIRDGRGFFALVAEPGMGKTTLLYRLLESLGDSARSVYLFQTQCDKCEFFQYLLSELGVDTRDMSVVALHSKLNETLFAQLLAGKRFVLVVDEAQNLEEPVLETIRLLSNFETTHSKLLQIVLAGQPELATKLAHPRLLQLRQRISYFGHLQPLSSEETAAYIEHRLQVAGCSADPLFAPEALAAVAQATHGIPRNINNLCYNALSLGYERGLWQVPADVVREAAARLGMETFADVSSTVTGVTGVPAVTDPQFARVAEAIPEHISEPIAEASVASVVEPRFELLAEPLFEPTAEAAPETIAEPALDPLYAYLNERLDEHIGEPGVEPVVESVPELVDEPAPQLAAELMAETLPESPAGALEEPVAEPEPEYESETESPELVAAPAVVVKAAPARVSLTYEAFTYQAAQRRRWIYPAAAIVILALMAASIPALLRVAGPGLARAAAKSKQAPPPKSPTLYAPEFGPVYSASPSDTDTGQVLTVVALPDQMLRDVVLQHGGLFDEETVKKIRALNPQMNPDQIDAGQLIRIPLPAGTWQKSFDTSDPLDPTAVKHKPAAAPSPAKPPH